MSSNVKVEIIRRADLVPYDSVWIGGNGVVNKLSSLDTEATVMGRVVFPFTDMNHMRTILTPDLFTYVDYEEFTKDIEDYNSQDYLFFLVVDS